MSASAPAGRASRKIGRVVAVWTRATISAEGDSEVIWHEGNYSEYEEDRKRRLGDEADNPHRIKYKKLA